MGDDSFECRLKDGPLVKGAPLDAIINVLIEKAMRGDLKAVDLIAKYGWGTHIDVTSDDRPMVPITALPLNTNLPERKF